MPSSKKSDLSSVDTEDVTGDDVVDLMDALEIGKPGLDPVAAKFRGVHFRINRHYSPTTIWEWSDLQRKNAAAMLDLKSVDAAEVEATNRRLMEIIVWADDHDKVDELMSLINDRSMPEAQRIYGYLHNLAGLTDKWGNPLAL